MYYLNEDAYMKICIYFPSSLEVLALGLKSVLFRLVQLDHKYWEDAD